MEIPRPQSSGQPLGQSPIALVLDPAEPSFTHPALSEPDRRTGDDWKRKTKRSLRLATFEATPASTSRAITDNTLVPLAIALGATSFQVGLLSAVPKLMAAIVQLMTPRLMEWLGGSRRVLYLSALAGALIYATTAVVPLLPEGARVWCLVVLAACGLLFLDLPGPAWATWFSSLVPANRRGRYQAVRQSLASVASIGAIIGTGAFLDATAGRVLFGFSVLLLIASLLRLTCSLAFFGVRDTRKPRRAGPQRDLSRFVQALSQPNIRNMLFYSFGLQIGTTISGAYFTAYQIQVLGFSYTGLMLPVIASAASGIVGLHFWGRMGDRSGNLGPVRIASVGIGILPLLWIGVSSPVHVAMINIAGGFLWTGYNLCAANYLCEITAPDDRANSMAYLSAASGIAGFLGSLIGAGLLMILPFSGSAAFIGLFIISALVRFGAAGAFLPSMTENRRSRRRMAG